MNTIKQIIPLEKVSERILFYESLNAELLRKKAKEKQISIYKSLLSFWTNYKQKNY